MKREKVQNAHPYAKEKDVQAKVDAEGNNNSSERLTQQACAREGRMNERRSATGCEGARHGRVVKKWRDRKRRNNACSTCRLEYTTPLSVQSICRDAIPV